MYVPEGYETPVACRSSGCCHKARSSFHLGIHAARVHQVKQYFTASSISSAQASNPAPLMMAPQATTYPIYFTPGLPQNVLLLPGNSYPFISSPPPLPVLDFSGLEATLSTTTPEPTVPYTGVMTVETMNT